MFLSLFFSLFLRAEIAANSSDSFELSKDQKECFSYSANVKKKPKPLIYNSNIDAGFLQAHPICQLQFSCLSPERLQLMKTKKLLPGPEGAPSRNPAKRVSENKQICRVNDQFNELSKVYETNTTLFSKVNILPSEINLSHKLIADTKKVVTNYLQTSQKANHILSDCFQHNEVMEKNGIPFEQRLQKASQDSRIPKVCLLIWGPQSPLPTLIQKNTELRQTLALLELANDGGFENSEQVFDLCNDIYEEKILSPFYKRLLNKKMSPPKSRFFGEEIPSDLWDNTPDQIEELNNFEKKRLISYLVENFEINKSPAGIKQLRLALSAHYFQLLNENPILIELGSAHPSATELKNAFQANQRKLQNLSTQKIIDDVDYLNFPAALSQVIESAPAEQKGDLCVLAHEMIQGRKNFQEAPGNVALGLMAVESFAAGMVVKGVLKKIGSFIFGARYSGTAYQALMINNGLEKIRLNTEVCLKSSTDSDGFCRADIAQKANSDIMTNAVLMGVFALPKPMKAFVPLLLVPSDDKLAP